MLWLLSCGHGFESSGLQFCFISKKKKSLQLAAEVEALNWILYEISHFDISTKFSAIFSHSRCNAWTTSKKLFYQVFSNSAIKETLKGQVNTFSNYLLFFAIRNEKTTTFIFWGKSLRVIKFVLWETNLITFGHKSEKKRGSWRKKSSFWNL